MVAFHGQMGMFTRALAYILSHGADGLRQVAEDAVLNANYVLRRLDDVLDAPFGASGPCMHEALFSDKGFAGGLTTLDLAKGLIDEGFHPMTMYFPLVVHGAMLVEPTETESKAALDQFIGAMRYVARAGEGRRPEPQGGAASTRRGGGSTRRWRRASRCWSRGSRTRRRRRNSVEALEAIAGRVLGEGEMTTRLDNFTDAAFAFAVTLLVIGGAGAPPNFDGLVGALGDIPAFAFGFAVVLCSGSPTCAGGGCAARATALSMLLTLLLIFLILIYVQPLRGMAAATAICFTGQGGGFGGSLSGLFAVYGTGFVAMSLTIAALFGEALRRPALSAEDSAGERGERTIWLILAATGIVSILVSLTRYGVWAAMLYATLPLTIGLFIGRYDWTGAGKPVPADRASDEARRSAPHVERNAEPIAAVLRGMLPERGIVLEVASGSGEHASISRGLSRSALAAERSRSGRAASIEAWRAEAGLANLLAPVPLDVRRRNGRSSGRRDPRHQHGPYQPLVGDLGLLRGAGRLLPPGAPLSSTAPIGGPGCRPRRATRRSTPRCGRQPRMGRAPARGCRRGSGRNGLRSTGWSRCRPTI